MKYLIQGMESVEKMDIILSLTKISSESMTDAILDHFVSGMLEKTACVVNGVVQQNFNKTIKRLNVIAGILEDYKSLN